MDLNHINLPASLVVELYQSSLIDMGEHPVIQAITKIKEEAPQIGDSWKWLGENQKKVLVIVRNEDVPYLPDGDLAFLTEILGACKLNLADVALVNLSNYPDAKYKDLVSFFESKIVFLFAAEPAGFGLPMNFPQFQIQPFAGCSFLYSPSLPELRNDKVLKSKLWVCLKRLFNL